MTGAPRKHATFPWQIAGFRLLTTSQLRSLNLRQCFRFLRNTEADAVTKVLGMDDAVSDSGLLVLVISDLYALS